MHHQHEGVVAEVRQLVDRLLPRPLHGSDDDLRRLLAALLQNLLQPFLEQVGGVAALRPPLVPVLKQPVQVVDCEARVPFLFRPCTFRLRTVETGVGPPVAGRPDRKSTV